MCQELSHHHIRMTKDCIFIPVIFIITVFGSRKVFLLQNTFTLIVVYCLQIESSHSKQWLLSCAILKNRWGPLFSDPVIFDLIGMIQSNWGLPFGKLITISTWHSAIGRLICGTLKTLEIFWCPFWKFQWISSTQNRKFGVYTQKQTCWGGLTL